MLHHIEIYVSDLERSFQFWSALLSRLGYAVTGQWDEGFSLGTGDAPYLTFVAVRSKHAGHPYNRCHVGLNHLSFRVDRRDDVDDLRLYCIAQGITMLYDDRYPFANGSDDYYALFLEDPDRIKIEFVAND
jgi:catechol 2,3-dioxygenase-like lactoylglutathione lyase family enzyme